MSLGGADTSCPCPQSGGKSAMKPIKYINEVQNPEEEMTKCFRTGSFCMFCSLVQIFLVEKNTCITKDIYTHAHTHTCGAFQVMLVVKNLPASSGNAGDLGSIPELERSPGVGNGNPLQYICLENSMDRGAWWATEPQRVGHA